MAVEVSEGMEVVDSDMEDPLPDLVILVMDLVSQDLVPRAMVMDSDIQVMDMDMAIHSVLPDQKFLRRVKTLSRTPEKRSLWQQITQRTRNKLFIWDMAMPVATTTVLDMGLEEWEVTQHYQIYAYIDLLCVKQ